MELGINLITGTGQLTLLHVCQEWRNVDELLLISVNVVFRMLLQSYCDPVYCNVEVISSSFNITLNQCEEIETKFYLSVVF